MNQVQGAKPGSGTTTVRFADVLNAVVRGAPLALLLAVLAAGFAFVLSRAMPPTYLASTSVLASKPPASYAGVELLAAPDVDPRVYQRVIVEGEVLHAALKSVDGRDRNSEELTQFLRKVRVLVDDQKISSVITIEVTDRDPELAAAYANAVANELIDWDAKRARQFMDGTIAALERSVDDIAALAQGGDQAAAAQLEARRAELAAARASRSSTLIVNLLEPINVAAPPVLPYKPRPVFNAFVAFVIGLLVGYGARFLLRAVRNPVGSVERLESVTGLPALAKFSRSSGSGRRGRGSDAGSFFRAGVMRATKGADPIVLGVSSPASFREKRGVAFSLAESFGRSGRNVLIIDADLRCDGPGLGIKLGATAGPGFEEYLRDATIELQAVTVTAGRRRLFGYLPVRTATRHPSELLEYGFERFLASIRPKFDVIIVDLPPVLEYADALAVAPYCSGLALCVAAGTNADVVRRSVELLDVNGVTLLGAVLTGDTSPAGWLSKWRPKRKQAPEARPKAEPDTAGAPAAEPARGKGRQAEGRART